MVKRHPMLRSGVVMRRADGQERFVCHFVPLEGEQLDAGRLVDSFEDGPAGGGEAAEQAWQAKLHALCQRGFALRREPAPEDDATMPSSPAPLWCIAVVKYAERADVVIAYR